MQDDLTQLLSRSGFIHALDNKLKGYSGGHTRIACMMVRLNEIKQVNANHGYEAGDQILQEFPRRVSSMLREDDQVARISGTRFALLLGSVLNSGHASLAANKLLTLMEQPFHTAGEQLQINVTIGIALFPEHGDDAMSILHLSETALDRAYQTHCDYCVHSPESNTGNRKNRLLSKEVKKAIECDELFMLYQPQLSLQSGILCSAEALVRWRHPQAGLVSPDQFISLAENHGLIVPLTIWTLNTTLRHCKPIFDRWPDFSVSVNLSAALLHEADLAEMIQQSMSIWGVRPQNLMLEVTESSMMVAPEKSRKTLCKLFKTGINISIDDFGTGHSSLVYLKQLPVNEIKIDKSFVMNMNSNSDDKNIVQSVIDLAHNFHLQVVAEGIETPEILTQLADMGCDIGQGYHISHPISADQLISELENHVATHAQHAGAGPAPK